MNIRTISLSLVILFAVAAQAKVKKPIERGMSKEQVADIIGSPLTTSFDANSETWQYTKQRGGLLYPYTVYITINFDNNGKVVTYNEKVEDQPSPPIPVSSSASSNCQQHPAFGHRFVMHSLSDNDFNTLLSKVKAASFESAKLDLIQVASLGGYFTCHQCTSLLTVFSFTDAKMKALSFVGPHIVDSQNAAEIYRLFTFSSDKDKAAEIISRTCQY